MLSKFIDQSLKYDGKQLSSLWAYKNFSLQGDSIVAFRGECHVAISEMVDLEDVKANAFIYSKDMLHFIIEHFQLDLEKTITRQRLLIAIIKELLTVLTNKNIVRKGDDIFIDNRKLSVSIATLSPVSTLIHIGINISSEGTPVPTISLTDLGIEDIQDFALKIMESYIKELIGIKMARCKVRGVI